MDLRKAKPHRRINFHKLEESPEKEEFGEDLVSSLHDGWSKRPGAWTRLLTLDRDERSFEAESRSFSRSRQSSIEECRRPRTQPAPRWSLRYCELLGVGPAPNQRRVSRRAALPALPVVMDVNSSSSSVFLASPRFRHRDKRLSKFDNLQKQESRLTGRRRAVQADVMNQARRCMRVAFSYMQMNHGERIEYLKKLFDAKLDRKGAVNRVEHGISNEELKHLAMKMGLPEQEVSHLNVQFRLYDFDGSETLDLEEVRNILADIGLSPQSREEKREVTECIQEKVQKMGCEEFEFEAFLDLLKSVKERMKQVQSIKCWRLFHEADVHGEDNLEMLQVMHLLENKLGFFLASAEEHTEAVNIFAQCDSSGNGCLNLDEFQAFVQKVRARLLTLRRREEVQIANRFGLEPEILHEFRSSLPFLWKIFERYSFGKEQGVRREDLLPYLVDVGLAPSNTEEPQCLPIIDVLSEFGRPYTKFPALLEILQKGRLAVRASLEEELTSSFHHYDRDRSGQLSMPEIYGILEEFGMLPRSKAEQQEVGQVIEQLDRDGSGAFDLLEFHDFFQMMIEQVRLSERKGETEASMALGFSDEQFAYLRRTWMALKPRMDGTVTQMNLAHSLVHLLELLNASSFSEEPVRNYMRSVQQAPDIPIDFVGFVTTVRSVMASAEEEEAKDGDKKKSSSGFPSTLQS